MYDMGIDYHKKCSKTKKTENRENNIVMGYHITSSETHIGKNPAVHEKPHTRIRGLSVLGLRYYSAELGRWISKELLGDHAFYMHYVKDKENEEILEILERQRYYPDYLFIDNATPNYVDVSGLNRFGNPVSGPEGPIAPGIPEYPIIPIPPPPPRPQPLHPPSSPGRCLSTIVSIGWHQLTTRPKPTGSREHCMASCRMAEACGNSIAAGAGYAVEASNIIRYSRRRMLRPWPTEEEILDTINDLFDNETGRNCAVDPCRSCQKCCEDET